MPQIARSSIALTLFLVAVLAFALGRGTHPRATPDAANTFVLHDGPASAFIDVRQLSAVELRSVRFRLISRLYGNGVSVPDPSLIYSLAITQREIDRRGE